MDEFVKEQAGITEEDVMLDAENEMEDFDLSELSQFTTRVVSRAIGDPGIMTIINSKKNGKRITFANDVIEKLGDFNQLQIAFSKQGIVIGENIPNVGQHFPLKKSGAKWIIYSAGLVTEISEKFGLDFSERVSITFQKVEYKQIQESKLAIISIQ
ncbi:hypothetical protein [Candidatus Clostridium helianthi]|jgi:hypothetical protein|uniref:Uncharacterized protein n=1 Tax=Candidatus Clostridium helianthi TaxID=3381660 RepID=A0ABW8SB36_9CLOT